MKSFLSILAISVASLVSVSARADIQRPLWDCSLTFSADGGGLQFFVGAYELSGHGTIRCIDIAGNTQDLPIHVIMGGEKFAARVAVVPFMALQGVATGIGAARGPEDLLGDYVVADANGAIIVGGGTSVAVRGSRNAVTMNLSLEVTEGLGIEAGVSQLRIIRQ